MLTRFVVSRSQPFAAGHEFGSAGAYEIVAGKAFGEVAPDDPRNACIVNLDRAPRNERGAVEYSCDVQILRPEDMGRGNGRILYEAPNRGSKRALMFLNDAPECNDPVSLEHAGNGFLMRWGYTWVTSGWQGDLVPWKDGMVLEVPVATEHGSPIQRLVRTEICVNRAGVRSQPLSGHPRVRGYAAANPLASQAELTVRMRSYGEREVIPHTDWAFAFEGGNGSQEVAPSSTHLHLPGGFIPGAIYELVYTARDPLVLGLGFAAVRDLVSFLRYGKEDGAGNSNPLADGTGVEKAYAWGRSQSGRFLRDLVYHGFNEDEQGRRVFDAIAPHASGGGRMFLNYEFARPVTSCQQHTNQLEPELFPFAYNVMEDPQTGRTDGILKRPDTDPLVIHTQTSTEYWQKRGSLAHTDGRGNDVPLPDGVRVYLMASTQHNAPYGTLAARGKTRYPSNPLPIGPALRALIVAMDRWATDGTAPAAEPHPAERRRYAGRPRKPADRFPCHTRSGVQRAPQPPALSGLRRRRRPWHHRRPSEAPARRRRLHHSRAGGGCGRQRCRRHPSSLDRRSPRHLHRMEPAVRRGGGRRAGGPAGLFHPVPPDPQPNARPTATHGRRWRRDTAAWTTTSTGYASRSPPWSMPATCLPRTRIRCWLTAGRRIWMP